jgi:hypothetical protein
VAALTRNHAHRPKTHDDQAFRLVISGGRDRRRAGDLPLFRQARIGSSVRHRGGGTTEAGELRGLPKLPVVALAHKPYHAHTQQEQTEDDAFCHCVSHRALGGWIAEDGSVLGTPAEENAANQRP